MALEELFARVLAEYGVNVVFKGRLSEYIAILDVEHDEYEEDPVSYTHLDVYKRQPFPHWGLGW